MEEAVEQLANLRRQIHNVQSRRSSCKRKSCESLLAEFSCPKRLQRRVLLVYIYSGHCSQVAAEFLKRSLAASSNSHGDSLDYEATVENLYIEAPLQVIVDLETEPMSCAQACDVIVAMEFALQHRLRSWVEHLNTDRGVTPSRAMMIADSLCYGQHFLSGARGIPRATAQAAGWSCPCSAQMACPFQAAVAMPDWTFAGPRCGAFQLAAESF